MDLTFSEWQILIYLILSYIKPCHISGYLCSLALFWFYDVIYFFFSEAKTTCDILDMTPIWIFYNSIKMCLLYIFLLQGSALESFLKTVPQLQHYFWHQGWISDRLYVTVVSSKMSYLSSFKTLSGWTSPYGSSYCLILFTSSKTPSDDDRHWETSSDCENLSNLLCCEHQWKQLIQYSVLLYLDCLSTQSCLWEASCF